MKIELVEKIPESHRIPREMLEQNKQLLETIKNMRVGEIIRVPSEHEDKKKRQKLGQKRYNLVKDNEKRLNGKYYYATRKGDFYVERRE